MVPAPTLFDERTDAAAPTAPATNGAANGTAAYGFSTRAIHIGSEPDAGTSAVIPAISLSTTYKQDGVGNFKHGLGFSSGSAVTATILAALPPASHIVSVNDVYGGTYRYFTKVASTTQNINVDFVEMGGEAAAVEERLRDAVKPETKIVWVETPTNPTLRLIDINLVARVIKSIAPSAALVVDSTFLSPWYQNPLTLGADIVVHSITKYINGHSDVVMGAAVTNSDEWANKLRFLQNSIGAVPSAFDSWLALRGLKTLALRLKAHGQSALAVATYLSSHPAVAEVLYPGLPSHASHALARRQVAKRAAPKEASGPFAYGGMVSFRLKSDPKDERPAKEVLKNTHVFTLAESLGGVESLIELPSLMTHASVSPEDREKLGVEHNLIRVSVGLEDIDDLIADLDGAFKAANLA
ncbi:related to cys3-cystathionine gamma-lyase [Ceraceosorus bombacis]|uniref:cystathionine gamma-lyase n=1 Tax=Ceraceosorus bombacis TaxID=401625 RepID=A0A0P1BK00_9BASI|nr:related to cys3-cystathionine gamma-lyase [Ceraceosorus bombacis]